MYLYRHTDLHKVTVPGSKNLVHAITTKTLWPNGPTKAIKSDENSSRTLQFHTHTLPGNIYRRPALAIGCRNHNEKDRPELRFEPDRTDVRCSGWAWHGRHVELLALRSLLGHGQPNTWAVGAVVAIDRFAFLSITTAQRHQRHQLQKVRGFQIQVPCRRP